MSVRGTLTADYVFGSLYVDEPIQMRRGAGTWWFHQNAVFSVASVTDQSGAVVERYDYRSIYGRHEVTGSLGDVRAESAIGNPWRFQGRRLDEETGLLYFRARFYDPEQGRFASRDPVLDPANLGNQYAFGGGDPINRVDPSGTQEYTSGAQEKALRDYLTFNQQITDETSRFFGPRADRLAHLEELRNIAKER